MEEISPTISNASNAHKLMEGVLEPKEVKTYELRLWMDYDTPALSHVMNASFSSKVTITSTYQENIIIPYVDNIKTGNIPMKKDKYEFEHYECNNEVELHWNSEIWDYSLENIKATGNQNIF